MFYTYTNRLRTSLSVQAPNASAWAETYGYDAARRLTSLSSPAGAFGYTLGGASSASPLIKKLSLPTGAFITNTYDSVARLLSTKLLNSQLSTLNLHSYGHNLAGQRLTLTNNAGDYRNYTYDKMGQLVTAKGLEPGGGITRSNEQFGYAYDPAGNLRYRTNNALIQSFLVNSLNELMTNTRSGTLTVAGTTTSPATNVTVSGTGLSSGAATIYSDNTWARAGATPADGNNSYTATAKDSYGRQDSNSITVYLPATNGYTYDLNGNMLSDGTRCFAWDDENELVSVWVTNSWRSDFAYDGKLRRRIRREYNWQSAIGNWRLTNEVRYVYDGNLVIQERDGGNLPQVSYTRGPDLSGSMEGAGGIGGLLARTDFGLWTLGSGLSHAFYHADGNGNVTCLINASNAMVARYQYDPYGNVLSKSGPLADANLYRFSSKELHANSGLIYYLYRYYDPNLQRWPNRDPLSDIGFTRMKKPNLLTRLQAFAWDSESHAWIHTRMPKLNRAVLGDGPNDFLFVDSNPISETDLYGLAACTATCDDDFNKRLEKCGDYAGTAGLAGLIGGGLLGGFIGARGGPLAMCGGAAIGAGINGVSWWSIVKAGCVYHAIIARGACYARCMSTD